MTEKNLEDKLCSYIEDAYAMEKNVLSMLKSMIVNTSDAQIKADLEEHEKETERHISSLEERLEAHGRKAGGVAKEIPAMLGSLVKGLQDTVRSDKPGKNARDGFVTEHLEIAAYELLERLADRAGDKETAQVAARNKRDEERMAQKIASNWDKFLDLTLEEAGIEAA